MRMMVALLSIGVLLGMAACKADPPTRVERNLATFAKHRILIGNKREKNPLPETPEMIREGEEAFSHYCVSCHGMDGQNTGVPFVDHMSPPVPSLASREVQRYTDGQLKWIIDNGIFPSGMPGSKGTLSDEEIWAIVLFLRHLPPIGSRGEPEMYSR